MTDIDNGPQPSNGLAIASLVLGIISVLITWIPLIGMLGTVLAVVGLVLGILALQKPGGRGMAIAGLVCAGFSLIITAFYFVGFLALIGAAAADAA